MSDKPTFSFRGYLPNGFPVQWNIPTVDNMSACAYAVAFTNQLLAEGFTLDLPGLVSGEERETIVTVMRRAKPSDDTVIIDFFPEWGAGTDEPFGTYKYLHLYMDKDKPEMIAEFLKFSGFKSIEDIPLYDAQASLKRTFGKKHAKEIAVPTPFKIVKKQGAEKVGSDGKTYKPWEFVRYEANNPTPTTPPPPAAAQPTAAVGGKPEPSRVGELENEALTITRIETRPDSTGWYGYGMFNDGVGSHEVRVNLFAPEDPKKVTDAGYKWVTSGAVKWPVILTIKDNRTRIATVEPLENQTEQTDPEPAWYATPVGQSWGVLKGWLLQYVYSKNTFAMNGSLFKRGIAADAKALKPTDTWATKTAGEVIQFLQTRHEEKQPA